MAETSNETPRVHVVPIRRGQYAASITPPWFVDHSEYRPKPATFQTLVNGEEAFGAVYRAIEAARKTVCIICWGFQPSMYFIRDGQHLMLGQLLDKKAREGVMVRVLCWAYELINGAAINVTGATESNTPGRWMVAVADRPSTSTDSQYAYDEQFFRIFDRRQSLAGELNRRYVIRDDFPKNTLIFTSRTFSSADSQQITEVNYVDQGISSKTRRYLRWFPSHHQKMVVTDYEDPQAAVGFVMGHNMLDAYWDTSEHSCVRHAANRGRNGEMPRHDYSSRVTGPIVGDLFRNFASAWLRETGQALTVPNFDAYPLREGDRAVCQILRTQQQFGARQDIMKCYLQAVSNASQYIHIENQYFRWPPLAEKIKKSAERQSTKGRTPETDGYLYLFVITNTSDEGMGDGTVNTYRMLDSLGRADRIPEVAREQRLSDIDAQIAQNNQAMAPLRSELVLLAQQSAMLGGARVPGATERYAAINARLEPLEARAAQLDAARARLQPQTLRERIFGSDRTPEAIMQVDVPGLKVHVATLVAPDTPAGDAWQEVYIHAKLMLIDDSFMTLGSANINTRSMQTDSELNIAHHRPEITGPLRAQQWAQYTSGEAAAGVPLAEAYALWDKVMKENTSAKKSLRRPVAQLAEFLRASNKVSNRD